MSTSDSLAVTIKSAARELGFELAGIAPAATPGTISGFQRWLELGFAGEMNYLPRRAEAYRHPRGVLESVRSVIVVGMNYHTAPPEPTGPHDGRIAAYAWGAGDYHDVLRTRLQRLAATLHQAAPGCRTRIAVDTAPLLERDVARTAGLGWFGKNTLLINKQIGSLFFLGAILTDLELDYDQPHETSHCGTCTRCLDVCPTDAFPEPYVLDARRCISYLTIELKSQIPVDLREGTSDWLFGCDLCQDVCPWNRKAPYSSQPDFAPLAGMNPASAIDLLQCTEAEFLARFGQTPLARPGWTGIRRNAAVVLGNHGDQEAVPALARLLNDPLPLLRGIAAWALGRLGGQSAHAALQARRAVEDNDDVIAELTAAIADRTSS